MNSIVSVKVVPFAVALLLCGAVSTNVAGQTPSANNGSALDSGYEHWRWEYQRRANPAFGIPPGAFMKAFEQIQASKSMRVPISTSSGQYWASIGPAPLVGGQINSPVPADAKVSGRV